MRRADSALWAFVGAGERFAICGEKFGFGEEAAEHWDYALVKGEDGEEGFVEVFSGVDLPTALSSRTASRNLRRLSKWT